MPFKNFISTSIFTLPAKKHFLHSSILPFIKVDSENNKIPNNSQTDHYIINLLSYISINYD